MTDGMKKYAGAMAGPRATGQRWSLSRMREVAIHILEGESHGALSLGR